MATRFDKLKENNNSIIGGYEGNSYTEYQIPSCGITDIDRAVFNLFDKNIPLNYNLEGEVKKVPVIFATGERFAILSRNKPITDKSGALILPLVSITRTSIDNKPEKGISNNEMFSHVFTRRFDEKNVEFRQLKNFEGLENLKHTEKKSTKKSTYLNSKEKRNIYETIEIPPIKYIGLTYTITIWSSFTEQMNKLVETIMSSYTINPGMQFKLESDKGYWFPAFIDNSFSSESSYEEFTDEERFIKHTFTLKATGYIIAPDIDGVKRGIKSVVSSPNISFDVLEGNINKHIKSSPIQSADPNTHLLSPIEEDDGIIPSQMVGLTQDQIQRDIEDNIPSYTVGSRLTPAERVGKWSTDYSRRKKIFINDKSGNRVAVYAKSSTNGETVYDQKYAESIFDINNKE